MKRFADRFFRWFCHPDYYDEIQGDLEEMYQRDRARGERSAQWKYLRRVVGLFRLTLIRSSSQKSPDFLATKSNSTMVKYYLTFAFRTIRFNPFFSAINVIGLSIGLASSTLTFAYLSHEWDFDTFHVNYENIYRLKQDNYQAGALITESATTFSQVALELDQAYPTVEVVCRINQASDNIAVQVGENLFREERVIGADASFFDLFNFKFIHGSPESALVLPNAIVLTSSTAKKYFGKADPLGKEITVDGAYGIWGKSGYEDRRDYIVSGVIEDLPENTHLSFDLLISFSIYSNLERELGNWGDSFHTYFRLFDRSEASTITAGLPAIIEKYRPDQNAVLSLQKMQDIHLTSNLVNEIKSNGDEEITWLLAAVAILILVIACTNYINFSTAKAINRQKEISIRKIYWANSSQLFKQLVAEATVLNGLSLLLVAIFILLTHSLISDALGFDLVKRLVKLQTWVLILAIAVAGTLLSGLYPAFYLSRLKPQRIIQSRANTLTSSGRVRKVLVAFQFTVSIVVIGCALVLYGQMDYVKHKDLGISIDKTLVINGPGVGVDDDSVYSARLQSFKVELQRLNNVRGVTFANFIPGKEIAGEASGYVRKVGDKDEQAGTYYFTQIGYDFISDFGIQMIAGRAFDQSYTTDQNAVLVNKEAARILGFTSAEEAVGQSIVYRMNSTPTIIGVVDNFHQFSLRQNFQPIIFEAKQDPQAYYYLKLLDGDGRLELPLLKNIWDELFPGNPFHYFFLDDFFAQQYTRDNQFSAAFGIFASLAVLVAAIGFFGLTYYTAVNRIKEIGIRKILGARFSDIVVLLSRGAIVFMLVAAMIGIPMIYYTSEKWLLNYAFRIHIQWWMMVAPVVLLFLISMSVVIFQSIKTYQMNPIDTLKTE